jgi:hypothetical protein
MACSSRLWDIAGVRAELLPHCPEAVLHPEETPIRLGSTSLPLQRMRGDVCDRSVGLVPFSKERGTH